MTRSILKAAGLAAAASLALAAPAAAAPGDNASALCTAAGNAVFPGDAPIGHGGCVSFLTTGQLKGGAYAAQCRNITQGKYPFTFYGVVTVRNPGECLNALRGFHTSPPPAPAA